ncbi:MAG: phosphonoacetaldehyde hydrolase [Desulfopila sp.]
MKKHSSQNFPDSLGLVVFDWAGTTVDFGCCAPVAAFAKVFQRRGIDITMGQAREPMGMEKRAHIEAVGQMEEVGGQWLQQYGSAMSAADIDAMFADFVPLLLEVLGEHSAIIPGVLEAVQWLRQHNIKVGASTGYFREAAGVVAQSAAARGFSPDYSISATEVAAGRPAPWMIFRVMEELQVYPPRTVVNVGDTVVDVETGVNAGVWAVGVAETGNLCGLSSAELEGLPAVEAEQRVSSATHTLRRAGAHYVIRNMRELPQVIAAINDRLANGEKP